MITEIAKKLNIHFKYSIDMDLILEILNIVGEEYENCFNTLSEEDLIERFKNIYYDRY